MDNGQRFPQVMESELHTDAGLPAAGQLRRRFCGFLYIVRPGVDSTSDGNALKAAANKRAAPQRGHVGLLVDNWGGSGGQFRCAHIFCVAAVRQCSRMRLWRAVAAVVRRRASVLFPRRASSGWRTGALGGFGLAAGFTVAHADNGEGDVPATGEKDILSNMTDADYDNMLNMMVQDAKCPECARKMLQGPCGMNLMRLLLCYTKGDDKANLEACAQEFGPALQACLERHKDYYGLHEDAEPSVDLGDADEEQQQPAVHA